MKQKTSKNRVDYTNSIIEGMAAAWPRLRRRLGSRQPDLTPSAGERPHQYSILNTQSSSERPWFVVIHVEYNRYVGIGNAPTI